MHSYTILIRVDGSVKIGLGHIFRMRDLAMYLSKNGIISIFIIQEDEVSQKLLEDSGHQVFTFTEKSEVPKLINSISIKQSISLLLNDTLETKTNELNTIKSSIDIPIITFDDTGAGLTKADAVINALVYSWNRYSKTTKMNNIFEGSKFLIIQDSIKKYSKLKRDFSQKSISISIGGSDTQNMSIKIINSLEPLLKSVTIHLILGPGNSLSEVEYIQKKFKNNLIIHNSPPNLFEIVTKTSLLICAGGMTLFEAISIGQPCAAIACEEHEIHNINSQKNHIVNLGFYKDLNFNKLYDDVKRVLSSSSNLQKMSDLSKQQVDFNGKSRILKVLRYWLVK